MFLRALTVAMIIASAGSAIAQQIGPLEIDQDRVAAHGIRLIEGRHLDIYTDMREADDAKTDSVAELTRIFDQAVPQWCDYFGIDQAKVADWKLSGFLMQDRQKFVDAGLWHRSLPQFLHGYQLGPQFWLDEQPSLYYRRHLMLHEGTHAFMNLLMGGSGAPWYSEGMAELLGCHLWQDGQLKLGYRIKSREESPYWGRVKVIQDAVAEGTLPTLNEVMAIENRAFLRTDSYAWAWAATAFLDGHPDFKKHFVELQANVSDRSMNFHAELVKELQPFGDKISEQWQLFLLEMDYGYDLERAAIVYRDEISPLTDKPVVLEFDADRGWQSTGVSVEAGQKFQLLTKGRYQVALADKPWMSEPQGITIQYHAGRPLGVIEMAIKAEIDKDGAALSLSKPITVGRKLESVAPVSGTVFVRINDSPNSLDDNSGKFLVRLQSIKD